MTTKTLNAGDGKVGWIDGLRKLGIVRYGAVGGTYTSARDMPDEMFFDDVYNAERETVTPSGSSGDNAKERNPDMFCQFCGSQTASAANFCPKCGKPVAGPQGFGPSANASPLAEPKRRMAVWKKVVLGAVAGIVLVVTLALYLTGDLLVPVNNQLSALRSGDLAAAYRETSVSFQKATPLADFARFVQSHPGLASNKEASFSERRIENEMGYVRGTLTDQDGGVLPIEYQLVKENEAWKILGINIPTAG